MTDRIETAPGRLGDLHESVAAAPPEGRPRWPIIALVTWIVIQMFRFIAIPLIVDVLDDKESVAWLYPAILDVVVASAAPFVAYLVWYKKGLAVWVIAIVFFVVSIIDHGDAITAGLNAPAPELFGGPDANIPSSLVPGVQTVIDVAMLALLASKRVRTYYLGTD